MTYKDADLFTSGGYTFIRRNNKISRIHGSCTFHDEQSLNRFNKAALTNTPCGVFTKNGEYTVLRNGDEDNNELVRELDNEMPTISFLCLSRFFDATGRSVNKTVDLLASGKLQMLEYTPDQEKDLTADEKKRLEAHRKSPETKRAPVPPVGFTLVGTMGRTRWHRAATVLIQDTRPNGKTFLFGQDEDTYFGCELRDNPTTIHGAYDSLIPDAAKRVPNVKRQGEWFAVPLEEDDVPDITEAVALDRVSIELPIDHEDANRHTVESEDCRVGRDGLVYALDPTVKHSAEEHADLIANGWIVFHRNTALRSFSEAGVD